MALPRNRTPLTLVVVALHYFCTGAVLASIGSPAFAGEDSAHSAGQSMMMFLQNFGRPFVDRSLASQLTRAVVTAKYPGAVLSSEPPEIADQGDMWLVTFKVVRWPADAQLIGDVKAIPISIRKADAAITDIFPDHVGRPDSPEAVRKRMRSDEQCKKCHLTTRSS